MTYGRVLPAIHMHVLDGAVVSRLAELGGSPSFFARSKVPSSGRLAEGEPPARRPPFPQVEKGSPRPFGNSSMAFQS